MTDNWEDIFKNLKDYEVEPRPDLWKGIKSEVALNNAAAKMKNQNIAPSAQLWNNLKYKLLLINFFKFSPTTFNVYYLGVISGIIAGIFLLWPKNTENTTQTAENIIPEQIKTSQTSEKPKNNNNKNITTANFTKKDNKNESSDSESSSGTKRNATQVKTQTFNNSKRKKAYVQTNGKILAKNTSEPTFTKEVVKSGVYIPQDTFIVYDTIRYYDTVKVIQPKILEEPKYDKGYWSFCSTGGFLWDKVTPASSIHSGLAEETDKSVDAKGHYTVMLEGGLKVAKNLYLGGGLGFAQYFESFHYNTTKLIIDTVESYKYRNITYYEYNQHNYIKYDTTGQVYSLVQTTDSTTDTVWQYQVDTIVFTITDSTLVTTKDSELVRKTDTNKVTYLYNYINKYSYMRIPLFVAYKINLSKNFDLNLKAGIVANILVNAKGYGISYGDAYDVVDINKLPLVKFNFETYAGIGLSYHLGNHYSLCSEIYYGSTIGSIYSSDYYLRRSFNSAGIKLGFKYGF